MTSVSVTLLAFAIIMNSYSLFLCTYIVVPKMLTALDDFAMAA